MEDGHPLDEVSYLYWKVSKIAREYGLRISPPEDHLLSGINTAVEIMQNTYGVIGDLYKRETGEDILEEEQKSIARNSFNVISQLASLHGLDFEMVRHYITKGDGRIVQSEFDSRKFGFEDSEIGKCLYLKDDPMKKSKWVRNRMQHKLFKEIRIDEAPARMRCPAMVNFGEGSAIKRLWDVYITL